MWWDLYWWLFLQISCGVFQANNLKYRSLFVTCLSRLTLFIGTSCRPMKLYVLRCLIWHTSADLTDLTDSITWSWCTYFTRWITGNVLLLLVMMMMMMLIMMNLVTYLYLTWLCLSSMLSPFTLRSFATSTISPAELWWNLALEYKVFLNADY